jgi:hypothetical protein
MTSPIGAFSDLLSIQFVWGDSERVRTMDHTMAETVVSDL